MSEVLQSLSNYYVHIYVFIRDFLWLFKAYVPLHRDIDSNFVSIKYISLSFKDS